MKKLFSAVRKGDIETVKDILSKHPEYLSAIAVPPPKNDAGQSLLQVSLKTGNIKIADYLIDSGINIHFMEDESCGNSWRAPVIHDAITAAIMLSRWNTYSEEFGLTVFSDQKKANAAYAVLEKLLKLGADVNSKDSNDVTGLGRAILEATQVMPRLDRFTGEFSTERLYTAELQADLQRIFQLLGKYGADFKSIHNDQVFVAMGVLDNPLIMSLLK